MGIAYKASIRQLVTAHNTANKQSQKEEINTQLLQLYAILDVPTRNRRAEPFPPKKALTDRVMEAYRSVCIAAGNAICSGQGKQLLHRLEQGKNSKQLDLDPKLKTLMMDNVRVMLTSTCPFSFKMSFGTLCATLTKRQLDDLIISLIAECDKDGKLVITPRLLRWRERIAKGYTPMGRRLFHTGRELYKFWVSNGCFPVRHIKCRIPEESIFKLCEAIHS
jgi:hypothetical protein